MADFDDIDDLDGLEIMTPLQFKLAIHGLRHSEKNIAAMRRILVDAEPPGDVMRDTGLNRHRISQLRADIFNNFKTIQEMHNLVYEEILTSPEDLKKLREQEEKRINKLLTPSPAVEE